MAVAVAVVERKTEDVILDATDRLIGRYGLRKMTMEDVAREAGVSRRTVYGYFPNKAELAMASIDRVVTKAQDSMRREGAALEFAPERLFRMLVARVKVRLEGVKDISQSLDSLFAVVRPQYMQRRRRYFAEEAEMLASVIRDGQTEGVFGKADPLETAQLLIQATNAYLPYSLSLEELSRPGDFDERIEKMAAILVAGITR